MQVVPQQQVEENGLAVGVVPQRGRTETGVEEAEELKQAVRARPPSSAGASVSASVPADGVELVQELVRSGVVIITLGSHQVQSPAVLGADLLHQVVRELLSLKRETGRTFMETELDNKQNSNT